MRIHMRVYVRTYVLVGTLCDFTYFNMLNVDW